MNLPTGLGPEAELLRFLVRVQPLAQVCEGGAGVIETLSRFAHLGFGVYGGGCFKEEASTCPALPTGSTL